MEWLCEDCGEHLLDHADVRTHGDYCKAKHPPPRISPELAAKIAAESYKFVDANSDIYTTMTDEKMIDEIASIIERVGNAE